MTSLRYLFFLIIFVPFGYALPEGFDPSCQSHYTQGYGYRLFFDIPRSSFLRDGAIQFNFSVSGSSDAHVLLAEKPNTYPGYEFVFGAGMNGFTEIRKYVNSKFEVKSTRITLKILSPEEFRNFSVTIQNGEITLTSHNNNSHLVLLSWKDASPLDVRYVSFCAWTGVSISWLYDCKGMKAVDQPLSTYRKLKRLILKGYDPYSIPVKENDTLLINASVGLHHVNLDEKKSILISHVKFRLSWRDFKIKWTPKDFDNITSITLTHREIWLPEFIVTNSVDDGSSPMDKAIIKISHLGVVSWEPDAMIGSWCSLDLKRWPFDSHVCDISLGLVNHPRSVQVSLMNNVEPRLTFKNSGWDLKSVTSETSIILNDWGSNLTRAPEGVETPQAVVLHFELERQSQFYIYSYFIPVFATVIIIFSSFWLPVVSSKRLFLHYTSFFLLLINVMALDQALPILTSSTPHIMSVSCGLLFLTTFHLIFSSCVMSSFKSNPLAPPTKFVTKIVTSPTVQMLFCLFGDYHSIEDEDMHPELLITDYSQVNHNIMFKFILDRIIFVLSVLYIGVILLI